MYRSNVILPLYCACGILLLQNPAYAQTPASQPAVRDGQAGGDSEVSPLVISVESSSLEDAGRRPEFTTATFTVPVPGMRDYEFDVMSVTNRGAGGGSTSDTEPDEFGIIHARVMRNPAVDQYFFLFATHRETGEQYFDLDLPPLRVSPVLGAIGLAKGRANNTRVVMPVFDVDADRDIIVQIRGERLAAEDVFDMIWEQTGCEITEEGKVLRVRNCLEPNDRGERP